MKCGLLGQTLAHSYSPKIHGMLADYTYTLFECEPEYLEAFLHSNAFDGLNITIPYKKAAIPFCQELTEVARQLGSINTIVRRDDGSLLGHNTDYFGFQTMVERSGLSICGKKVLVLGSGGASATVCAVLKTMEANVIVISRTGNNHYGNLHLHKDASVIVNTTPVGMYPNTSTSPVDLTMFPHLEGVLDLIYNPARTRLMMDAEAQGILTMNGLWMLVAQAKESAELFTGRKIPDHMITTIYESMKRSMENIVLIGMPGCGKSTIGNILAHKLSKEFVDVDAEIERIAGLSIPDIFAQQGEDSFRTLETEALKRLGMKSGLVIATGGGCVTRKENYPLLHQNGTIYWICREISALPTHGRPLSQSVTLAEMYHMRRPMYEAFADKKVANNKDAVDAVLDIMKLEGYF